MSDDLTFGPCPLGDRCHVSNCDGTDLGHDLAVDFPAETARVATAERELLERMRDGAAANGDYESAAALDERLKEDPR